jgi:hypothetical protein
MEHPRRTLRLIGRFQLGTQLKVTNPRTGRSAHVVIKDRGPFIRDRVLDISSAVASTTRLRKERRFTAHDSSYSELMAHHWLRNHGPAERSVRLEPSPKLGMQGTRSLPM